MECSIVGCTFRLQDMSAGLYLSPAHDDDVIDRTIFAAQEALFDCRIGIGVDHHNVRMVAKCDAKSEAAFQAALCGVCTNIGFRGSTACVVDEISVRRGETRCGDSAELLVHQVKLAAEI